MLSKCWARKLGPSVIIYFLNLFIYQTLYDIIHKFVPFFYSGVGIVECKLVLFPYLWNHSLVQDT